MISDRVRKLLDQIEDVLIEEDEGYSGGNDGSQLWDIITALRGPDNQDSIAKEATIQVRRLAFPRLAAKIGDEGGQFSNYPVFVHSSFAPEPRNGGHHFAYHIHRALGYLEE